jgi:pimeloyl-ACP methyl ester carboxylesterase
MRDPLTDRGDDWGFHGRDRAVERLQHRGFTVVAPPNPLRGPASDAPYPASFLQTIPGPNVLVAHSYGGFVATNAATGNANGRALVYIDAFTPDARRSLGWLLPRRRYGLQRSTLPGRGRRPLRAQRVKRALSDLLGVARQRRQPESNDPARRGTAAGGT